MTRDELKNRIDTIEESYEFFLAYAAQGVSGEGGGSADKMRDLLRRVDEALTGLGAGFMGLVNDERLGPAEVYRAMIDVLDRDAASAQAALRLVMAQQAISSQLVDNLNASIHVRALLTDLFLLDEVVSHASTLQHPDEGRARTTEDD